MRNVLAICGSTRKSSVNHRLIKALIAMSKAHLQITLYDSIEKLPQFNPDNDGETVVAEVASFRAQLDMAEGVIICTPEYAHGVPGALKNAIDWTISSGQFPNKPTMLITAATDGSYAHSALIQTLKAISVKNIDSLQLVISFASTKIDEHCQITDSKTSAELQFVLTEFIENLDEK